MNGRASWQAFNVPPEVGILVLNQWLKAGANTLCCAKPQAIKEPIEERIALEVSARPITKTHDNLGRLDDNNPVT